jgi:hypothetical protein
MSCLDLDPNIANLFTLARLVERETRHFGEKGLTGAGIHDVAETFDAVWFDVLVFKVTVLNLPSCLVKIISSYLRNRTFEASFQAANIHLS